MSRSAQEMVDAIITAGEMRGADGRGKDGLDGYMLTMARTDPRRFGTLLGWALRLKMKARRGTDDEKPDYLTLTRKRRRNFERPAYRSGFSITYPQSTFATVPADRRKRAQPNGTRVITEAVINAAIRHGRDGRGKGWLARLLIHARSRRPSAFRHVLGHRAALAVQIPAAQTGQAGARPVVGSILPSSIGGMWGART